MITKVIYEKETKRILAIEIDGVWVLPEHLEIKQFKGSPKVTTNENGDLYLLEDKLA